MANLNVVIPDHTYDQLEHLAERRAVGLEVLLEQLAASALVEFDLETRFLIRARRGTLAHTEALPQQEDHTA